jgi:group II intron reverse transcriptase/maturase
MMHGGGKSDFAIVAVKLTNKAERSAAELVEQRAGTKGNADQQSTRRTQSRESVAQALERIRKVARERKQEKFTALFHHISIDLLDDAFFALKENAAPGVDRLTWRDYEADLERNLTDLHDRVHRGAYRAMPSRRVYIPKADGRQRPLAVVALEDKIVQRAVVALLNAIYEEDFLGVSYGFRPGRGTHDALDALCVGIDSRKVSYILDADIRSFFDEINQQWLIRFLEHRIGDRRIIRLIQKWLKAGVMEDGVVTVSDRGTGQGSVISPLLANIYLHYTLDQWAVRWRQREATGDMIFVRYADDFIVGFQHERDACRFLDEMRERLGKFALTLHPEKTRLIEFGRFAAERRNGEGSASGRPSTFWASPSSAAKPARANSRSKRRPGRTACGRSSRWFKRKCGGACTSPSPIRGSGCATSSVATSIITQCRPILRHSWHSELRSPDVGGGQLLDAANGRRSTGNR